MIFGHLPTVDLYHPFLLLAKGTLTGVRQIRTINWVLVKNITILVAIKRNYYVVKFIPYLHSDNKGIHFIFQP